APDPIRGPRPARRRGWYCRRRWRAAWRLSDQEYVAGMYDAQSAVRQAEPEGAFLVEAVEQAFALAGRERRAGGMGDCQPLAADRRDTERSPAGQPAGEGF